MGQILGYIIKLLSFFFLHVIKFLMWLHGGMSVFILGK